MTGGIRQGTGSDTCLLMIAGEELDMALSQLEFVVADTAVTPDTGSHGASNTIASAGPSVRAAAAWLISRPLPLAPCPLPCAHWLQKALGPSHLDQGAA